MNIVVLLLERHLPSILYMNDRKTHSFIFLCARDESIGIQKVKCFAKLTFCVAFEFLPTDSKRGEESFYNNGCTSL